MVSVNGIVKYLKVSHQTVYDWVKRGLPCRKMRLYVGGIEVLLIDIDCLINWLKERGLYERYEEKLDKLRDAV
jgi:phage terminase Nu1 subunit (DNA packaging protein)